MLLDLGGEAQQAQNLSHPSPGEALAAGDGRLSDRLAGLQEGLPLDGLVQEFDDSGCLGTLWRCWRGPR